MDNRYLKDFECLKDKKVLLAVSTGVDSMVMLDNAINYLNIKDIVIVHVNHKKRQQSEIEEQYILDFANKHNINIYIKHLEEYHGSNFQEWARLQRYNFFKEIYIKEQCEVLLLAHHADDNLETILMRLIKASSIEAYSGISQDTLNYGMHIYRPFIKYPKDDLIDYAKRNNIKYFEDQTNAEDDYLRNRIRHNIVPLLKEENPNIYNSINYYSESLNYASLLIKEEVDKVLKQVNIKEYKSFNIYTLDYNLFNSLDEYLKKEVLFTLLKKYQFSTSAINNFILQLKQAKVINQINDTLLLIKEYNLIKIVDGRYENKDINLNIKEDSTIKLNNEYSLNIKKNNNYNGKNKIIYYNIDTLYIDNYPITIRSRSDGDNIEMNGHHKKLSDVLTNEKVNTLARNCYVVLFEDKIIKVIINDLERGC